MEVSFNRPTLPPYTLVSKEVEAFYDSGMITNGRVVRDLEDDIKGALGVGNAVAVSCCTSGLMLALKCLGLSGKVAIPSFTFFASAHAAVWNGLEPVFVDVDPDTWNISPESLEMTLKDHGDISAVLPVHVFGNPCDVYALESLAEKHGISLVYDSAHAMGSMVGGHRVGGFGDAEVFSMSPTKLVVAGEGGVMTTDDEELASKLRAGRDYGNTGDYDPSFIGLNARMSEFHAALAIESFRLLEENVRRRGNLAARYTGGLADVRGITFQEILKGSRSTFKDFTVLVSEEGFGASRDALAWHLAREGIDTRKYYHPPVHRTTAYWEKWGKKYDDYLPVTNKLAKEAMSLPIWSHMDAETVDVVVESVLRAHDKAGKISAEYSMEINA